MGKKDSKPILIVIALKYDQYRTDPEKLREFWSKYLDVLPHTGLLGMIEGTYKESGVSVYDGKEIPKWV